MTDQPTPPPDPPADPPDPAGTGRVTPRMRRWQRRALAALSVVALVLLVVHLIWPNKVDAVTLGLLVVAALPCLGLVLSSAELPGGIKIQFRALNERMNRTEEAAQVAIGAVTERATETARHRRRQVPPPRLEANGAATPSAVPDIVASGPPPEEERLRPVPPPSGVIWTERESHHRPPGLPPPDPVAPPPGPVAPPASPPMPPAQQAAPGGNGGTGGGGGFAGVAPVPGTVGDLAAEYSRLRAQEPSGPARTAEQNRLIGRLLARTATDHDFDPDAALRSQDPGMRLAGYAYQFGQGEPTDLPALLSAVEREQIPFSQYWALRALDEVGRRSSWRTAPPDLPRRLRALRPGLRTDSSRLMLLDSIATAAAAPRADA